MLFYYYYFFWEGGINSVTTQYLMCEFPFQALNRIGLRVVLDVVYNHLDASGLDKNSVLDKVISVVMITYFL